MLSGRGGRGVSDEIALKVDTLDVHYKDFQALWNVSLSRPGWQDRLGDRGQRLG